MTAARRSACRPHRSGYKTTDGRVLATMRLSPLRRLDSSRLTGPGMVPSDLSEAASTPRRIRESLHGAHRAGLQRSGRCRQRGVRAGPPPAKLDSARAVSTKAAVSRSASCGPACQVVREPGAAILAPSRLGGNSISDYLCRLSITKTHVELGGPPSLADEPETTTHPSLANWFNSVSMPPAPIS